MRHTKQLRHHGWAFGVALLVMLSVPQVGFAERALKQLPADVISFSLAGIALPQAVAEVTKENGLLAGASWGMIKGSSDVLGRVVSLVDGASSFNRNSSRLPDADKAKLGGTDSSLGWLNLRDGDLYPAYHEMALLRYTF